ncbi:hypothetical protein KR546_10325 [Nitriliruptoria bacterium AS10]|nr:hypothetical protein [Salsipaludibacter albus]
MCDEYPFASTLEGVRPMDRPSLPVLPRSESSSRGGSLSGFYNKAQCQPFVNGTKFGVIPLPSPLVPSFGSEMGVADALQRLVEEHGRAGAPLRDCLADALPERRLRTLERRTTGTLPSGVADLHLVADGVDDALLVQHVGHWVPYRFFPGGPIMMPLRDAIDFAAELRSTAEELSRDSAEEGGEAMWRSSWTVAYEIRGGEAVVVDTAANAPPLWLVQWENRVQRPLGVDMEGFLRSCADRMAVLNPSWNMSGYFDSDAASETPQTFPGLE